MAGEEAAPKLFVSYSWTDPEHEKWVVSLASELVDAGVDVILDKWDLHPGHDANRFMEQMVTDPTVTKVIMVCDKAYAEKADKRKGGAGTEAQIISPELYGSAGNQDKFVAVIREKEENGRFCCPTFARNRIHIDFVDDAERAKSFDHLIRWVYGKPVYVKPERGPRPAYLDENEGKLRLATSAEARRAVDALRNSRPNSLVAVSDYFRIFASELEKLRLPGGMQDRFQAVLDAIDQTPPFRDEALGVIFHLLRYADTNESWESVGSLFEALIVYDDWPDHVQSWNDIDADHYRFLIQEMFLHCMAFALSERKFGFAKYLVNMQLFYKNKRSTKSKLVDFNHLRYGLQSIDYINSRSSTRYYSLHAKMLVDRAVHTQMKVQHIAQADFILYLCSITLKKDYFYWFPLTLLGDFRSSIDMEIFTRAKSRKVLAQVLDLLGLSTKQELIDKLSKEDQQRLPTLGPNRLYPLEIIDANHLGEVP